MFLINRNQKDLIQGSHSNPLSSLFHTHKKTTNQKIPLSYQTLETMETSVL